MDQRYNVQTALSTDHVLVEQENGSHVILTPPDCGHHVDWNPEILDLAINPVAVHSKGHAYGNNRVAAKLTDIARHTARMSLHFGVACAMSAAEAFMREPATCAVLRLSS